MPQRQLPLDCVRAGSGPGHIGHEVVVNGHAVNDVGASAGALDTKAKLGVQGDRARIPAHDIELQPRQPGTRRPSNGLGKQGAAYTLPPMRTQDTKHDLSRVTEPRNRRTHNTKEADESTFGLGQQ